MSIPSILQRSNSHIIPTFIILLLIFIAGEIHGFEIRKLDETGSTDPSIKCGGCSPCGHPSCYSSPPPPSYPPPPPPSLPPPPKKPATPYCPPPPSSPASAGYVYMTAPPGELYPVDHNYSGSPKTLEDAIKTVFLGFGFLGLLLILCS